MNRHSFNASKDFWFVRQCKQNLTNTREIIKMKESPELKDKICDTIANGSSVDAACKALGITKETLYCWVRKDTEFRAAFDRAKDERIEASLEEANRVIDEALNLKMDGFDKDRINAARLKADNEKWFAARRLGKKYGAELKLGNIDDAKPFQIAITKTYEK